VYSNVRRYFSAIW